MPGMTSTSPTRSHLNVNLPLPRPPAASQTSLPSRKGGGADRHHVREGLLVRALMTSTDMCCWSQVSLSVLGANEVEFKRLVQLIMVLRLARLLCVVRCCCLVVQVEQ